LKALTYEVHFWCTGQVRIPRSSGKSQGHSRNNFFLAIAYHLSGRVVCYHRYVRGWSTFDRKPVSLLLFLTCYSWSPLTCTAHTCTCTV